MSLHKDGDGISAKRMETKRDWQETYFWGNGVAEVEKDDSKDTFACDDDAHKADMCPESHVL